MTVLAPVRPRGSHRPPFGVYHLKPVLGFRPVIDRTYPLEAIRDAFTYVASGQKIGNVIVTMS